MDSMRRSKLVNPWTAPALWAASIFATSSRYIDSRSFIHAVAPALPSRQAQYDFPSFWHRYWWVFVKGWHVTEYAVLTLLLIRPIRTVVAGSWPLLVAFLASVGYAASDEFHQTFVHGRGGRVTDVAIDTLGATLGLMAILIVPRLATVARVRLARHVPSPTAAR